MSAPLLIACDGSSHKNGFGGAIGWAWAREDGHWMSNGFHTGTNQRAELWAILSILQFHPHQNIKVQMDSQYALNVTSKWAASWARNNWIKVDRKPIANLDIIQPIHELMTRRVAPIEFMWVKGHRKDNAYPLNTVADVRAGEASERAKAATNPTESLLLYADSKGRTHMQQEYDMMKRITESQQKMV